MGLHSNILEFKLATVAVLVVVQLLHFFKGNIIGLHVQ